jgi:hypothetical protein
MYNILLLNFCTLVTAMLCFNYTSMQSLGRFGRREILRGEVIINLREPGGLRFLLSSLCGKLPGRRDKTFHTGIIGLADRDRAIKARNHHLPEFFAGSRACLMSSKTIWSSLGRYFSGRPPPPPIDPAQNSLRNGCNNVPNVLKCQLLLCGGAGALHPFFRDRVRRDVDEHLLI